MIHLPSLGIGAGIAAVIIIGGFFAFNVISDEKELIMEPAKKADVSESPKITLATFIENGSPILGNPNAPITLVEFGDYQCFFCNKFFHETEDELFKNYVETGKVKVVFKDFTIIGADSVNAAHAAHCASDQGKFWEYHDTLYNHWTGENNGWASQDNLYSFAKDMNLDMEQFTKCMNDKKYESLIQASNADAKALELGGTPGFFVISKDNKITKIGGAQPFEVFQKIFDSSLES